MSTLVGRPAPPSAVPVGTTAATPQRHLSWFDAVAVVVGIVIGSGVFITPSLVAGATGTPGLMLLAWLAGGFLCLCGALTYAELATAYPHSGGEYVYLTRAFGRPVGFFFAWSRTLVIQTGSIAALAYIFGRYMQELGPLGARGELVYALAAAVALTAAHAAGVHTGKWTQNVLTVAKVLGVLAVVAVGLCGRPAASANVWPPGPPQFGFAMIMVLYTFGGWSEAAYVAGEVRRRGDMRKTLFLSVAAVTALYLLINLAYLRVLGIAGVAESGAVAADTLAAVAGPAGSRAISVLVALAALGAIHGCIFTGARSAWALGSDFHPFRMLARWHGARNTPLNAILVQGAIVVILIVLPALGPRLERALGSGFQSAVEYTAPVFWTFLLLTGLTVFVLRRKEPGVERPFRIPLYPLPAILFVLMCGYMLYSSIAYTKAGALVGLGVLAAGVPVFLLFRGATRPQMTTEI